MNYEKLSCFWLKTAMFFGLLMRLRNFSLRDFSPVRKAVMVLVVVIVIVFGYRNSLGSLSLRFFRIPSQVQPKSPRWPPKLLKLAKSLRKGPTAQAIRTNQMSLSKPFGCSLVPLPSYSTGSNHLQMPYKFFSHALNSLSIFFLLSFNLLLLKNFILKFFFLNMNECLFTTTHRI